MTSTQNWLLHDHSHYEENLSRCQDAIKSKDWDKADSIFKQLVKDLKLHILQEEEVVFAIYDALVKISHDPTRTLRTEHDRIISFMQEANQFITTHDSEHGIECLRRLKDLMIKHHEKEEDIFLPMAGYVLSSKREDIMDKLNASSFSESGREWNI